MYMKINSNDLGISKSKSGYKSCCYLQAVPLVLSIPTCQQFIYIIFRLYHIMDLRMHIFDLAIPALTLLAMMALLGVAGNPEVLGQPNATNATGSGVSQTANGIIANMTSSDFQPLQDLMNEARDAIHNNDTAGALDALNDADSQLSELSNSTSDDNEESEE